MNPQQLHEIISAVNVTKQRPTSVFRGGGEDPEYYPAASSSNNDITVIAMIFLSISISSYELLQVVY